MSGLAVVPTFLRNPADLEVTVETLESLRHHEPDLPTLVVDDRSPADVLFEQLEIRCGQLNIDVVRNEENSGFSQTVNVGLRRALENGDDAILVNADITFGMPFVEKMVSQLDTQGRPASVVGALLIYPQGLIQHAGIFFSLLSRAFDHRYRYAPSELPEAQRACCCPVTGALQYIRHECLESVGIYDEDFRMSYEDVDYCLRVFDSGRECIYQPSIRALHHESLFRGNANEKLQEWQNASWFTLMRKHQKTNMSRFVPELV